MDQYSLLNKTALVTGSCGLLGREHCKALSDAGASVVVTDIDPALCEKVADGLQGPATAISMDVSSESSIKDVAKMVTAEFGQIDILVNNAALNEKVESLDHSSMPITFEEYSLENWDQQLKVNLTGVFLCCQIFGSKMAELGYGNIINIASTYALQAPDQTLYLDDGGCQRFIKSPAYPVTKAAVLSLTRYLAAYWGRIGVRVNSLTPGGVQNGQEDWFVCNYNQRTPLGRMAQPTDYRGALVFLASDASAYMTGANLVVDGGWTIW
jgi:NAD(P)-dependent dehydrogenase (short-subunit alcohol dehydrogenase family)